MTTVVPQRYMGNTDEIRKMFDLGSAVTYNISNPLYHVFHLLEHQGSASSRCWTSEVLQRQTGQFWVVICNIEMEKVQCPKESEEPKQFPYGTEHYHDDVIKWKHFPRNWPFVREIHRSPVNFPHKGQWRGALMFSLIYAWINDWVNNREAGDLRRQHGHYDVFVMLLLVFLTNTIVPCMEKNPTNIS